MKRVIGGGFDLLTNDPVVIAVVRRCEELSKALGERLLYRSMVRDVSIRRSNAELNARRHRMAEWPR